MDEIIFAFPSFTYANKARRLLQKAKLAATPIKLGPMESSNGCAYGLAISRESYYTAVNLFIENEIEYSVLKK